MGETHKQEHAIKNINVGRTNGNTNTANPNASYLRLSTGLPAGIDVTDVLWASNFAGPSPSRANRARGAAVEVGEGEAMGVGMQPRPVKYSKIPPFRFAAEFPNPRGLKEKRRVYSRTVFYAGSCWNMYVSYLYPLMSFNVKTQGKLMIGADIYRRSDRRGTLN